MPRVSLARVRVTKLRITGDDRGYYGVLSDPMLQAGSSIASLPWHINMWCSSLQRQSVSLERY